MMWFSHSFKSDEWKWMPDKATLHQSAIELRGSTVVSASRGLLVEVCPTPMHEKMVTLLLSTCVILPPLVCLNSDATFLSFSCTACFRVVFVLRQVLFHLYGSFFRLMQWFKKRKKDNKRYIKLSLLLSGFVLMCLGQCVFKKCVPMLFISCTTNTRRNAQTKAVNKKTALKQTCKQCLLYVQYVIT